MTTLEEHPEFEFDATSHMRLRPDERCLDVGLITTAWNAGTVHVQYVGLDPIEKSDVDLIGETMWKFVSECHMMIVLYAGILFNRDVMRHAWSADEQLDSLRFAYANTDGKRLSVRVPKQKVIDAFTEDGVFERLYAKSYVVFTYQLWEESVRPQIAKSLNVEHDDVKSDLMGEWRHLRNLLVHPSKENHRTFVDNSDILTKLRVVNDETLDIDSSRVFSLMAHLSTLQVVVNPKGLDPGIELSRIDEKTLELIAKEEAETGTTFKPIWH